jgi:hypothetical protein
MQDSLMSYLPYPTFRYDSDEYGKIAQDTAWQTAKGAAELAGLQLAAHAGRAAYNSF